MRLKGPRFPKEIADSRDEFANHLARTAHVLPAPFIDKSIGDKAARCKKFYEAEGGLFEQGGEKNRKPL